MRLALLALLPSAALAQEAGAPLSSIDWLSRSVEATPVRTVIVPPPGTSRTAPPGAPIAEPPVAETGAAPGVTVTPLDGRAAGAVGVLPPEATGLPASLWSGSAAADLRALLAAEAPASLPALDSLERTLMLAEADPPAGDDGTFLLVRVDALLRRGALLEAQALLEAGDLAEPEAFRRWFDVTLLRGEESRACDVLRGAPTLAPTLDARVFCLARNGDWAAAALTVGTARALGDIAPEDEALLVRFLDDGSDEEAGPLPPASRPTPLDFRLREAVGATVPTQGLPLPFAHADLRSTAAWRAQIEAAERLARAGVLPGPELLRIYLRQRPAASGGVWDRAAAAQALQAALEAGDAAAVEARLAPAWDALAAVGLPAAFAEAFGPALAGLRLPGEAEGLALRASLLSPAYREAARGRLPRDAGEAVWLAVARGDGAGLAAEGEAGAVLAGLNGAALPEDLAALVGERRLGEAALAAIARVRDGVAGDRAALAGGLATLRALGLEDTARRAALQHLILGAQP